MLLAFLLPPFAVYRRAGRLGPPFWVACVLTVLFYLPGALFAVWIVRKPRR